MLSVDALLEPLATRVSYDYVGEQSIQFRGIALRTSRRSAGGRFMVLVDSKWGKRVWVALGYPDRSREEVINEAHANGAAGFVVHESLKGEPFLADKNCFFVANTLDFAFRLVETVRALTTKKVVAVTGSAGKSTTKAMVTHVLRHLPEGPEVYSPPSADNIFTSVTCQLSRVDNPDYSVLEVAGSAFLRFHKNDFTVSPDVAILTSISEAHLDYLDDLEGIARRKSRLFDRQPAGGQAVINLDTPRADQLIEHAQQQGSQVVTFGESAEAMVRLLDYQAATRHAVMEVDGTRVEVTIGAAGRHMAVNALAVLATLRALQIPNWAEALASLETFDALPGRGATSTLQLSGGAVTVIDESYNANPASIRAALNAMANRPVATGGRRIVVLGDMLELGAQSEEIHRDLAPSLEQLGDTQIHLLGEQMAALHAVVHAQRPGVRHWSDLEELRTALLAEVQPGDVILLKGSNGMRLGTIAQEIQKLAAVPAEPAGPEQAELQQAEPAPGEREQAEGEQKPEEGRASGVGLLSALRRKLGRRDAS